ncbi:MAG: type secretion system baseplate subunit TssE [Pseudomonadota bacterium]|jgi:type VI secretion system protein ImpF
MSAQIQDRLQPALLDRLIDEHPQARQDPDDARVMSKSRLRHAVLRDLSWLLNAVQPLRAEETRQHAQAAASVLNFGLPPMAGQLASRVDVPTLERLMRQAILRFEPRILADTLVVRALEFGSVLDTHNIIEFEIRGHLWAQPVPLELLLRTRLDLEAGQIEVREAGRATVPTLSGLVVDASAGGRG